MRSRVIREGSVGLLIVLGVGVFIGVGLWLSRFTAASSSYKVIVEFADAAGIQKGATVRFRGVKIGRISSVRPGPNGVEVEIDVNQPDLIIPRDVVVEANQSGLISESMIDITPRKPLPPGIKLANALSSNCNPTLVVCNGSHLKGEIGVSVDELIRYSSRLADVYSQPKVFANVNQAVNNASVAAVGVTKLTNDLDRLAKSTEQKLDTFAAAANSVQKTANQVSNSTTQLTASSTRTINQFGATATELRSTAGQASKLVGNLDNLVTTNRSSLVLALNNITQLSNQLRGTVSSLSPAINRFTTSKLLDNLETLSVNAAQASTNLRDVTKSFNDPNNLVLLQKTLDSARVTFENTQKITSDLDELTGDPSFRTNLRRLVNGLSGLVSSTQEMQQQVKLAETLDSVKTVAANHQSGTFPLSATRQNVPAFDSTMFSTSDNRTKNLTIPSKTPLPTTTDQPDILRFIQAEQKKAKH
jgi:phospholipid/cholesterol/gamma-HCH transport system substrate-binding protein